MHLLWDLQMPIKKLLMLVEMAVQGKDGRDADAIVHGNKKIDINYFYDCMHDIGSSTQE